MYDVADSSNVQAFHDRRVRHRIAFDKHKPENVTCLTESAWVTVFVRHCGGIPGGQ